MGAADMEAKSRPPTLATSRMFSVVAAAFAIAIFVVGDGQSFRQNGSPPR